MRESLFRGKLKYTGQWREGYLVTGRWYLGEEKMTVIMPQDLVFFPHSEVSAWEDVDPETVGEYSGLPDKNGVRIFEDDIVKVEYTGKNQGLEGVGKVVFADCKFALEWGNRKEPVALSSFCNSTFEVIGNIHDNPELLEGSHD